MRAESCPDCHVPLMSQGGREGGGVWECVACEGRFGPEGGEEEEEGREEEVVVKENKNVSAEIGQRLLQGWALLAESCEGCATPLMRDREGGRICLGCGGGGQQQKQRGRGGQEEVEDDEDEDDEEAAAVQAALIAAASRVAPSSLPSSSSSSTVATQALGVIYQRMEMLTLALGRTHVSGYEETGRIALALTRLGEAANVMERCVLQQQQQQQQQQNENVPPKRSRVG